MTVASRGLGWPLLLVALGGSPQAAAGGAAPLALDVGGYLAGGVDHYGSFHDEEGAEETTEAVLRKAKLAVDAEWGERWQAEIEGGYQVRRGDAETELGDAYIRFSGDRRFRIQLGRFKEPFGLERLTGYTGLATAERSLVTSLFAPGRSTGFLAGRYGSARTWALGLFTETLDGHSNHALTGRYTLAAVRLEATSVHFGIAASYRWLDGGRFQAKDEAEVFSADNVVRSARFSARRSWQAGVEAAWLHERLSLVSEAMVQGVEQNNGLWWRFSGAYGQASLFLTDDRRRYGRGELKRVKPSNPRGALELVTRYSVADMRDRGLGARASVTLVGLNYYLGSSLQIRANYLMPGIEGNVLTPFPEGDAWTLRAVWRYAF